MSRTFAIGWDQRAALLEAVCAVSDVRVNLACHALYRGDMPAAKHRRLQGVLEGRLERRVLVVRALFKGRPKGWWRKLETP